MEALQSYGNTASSMGKGLNDMIEAVADASTNEFERLKEFGIKAKQQTDTVTFTFQGVETTVAKNSTAIQQDLLDIGNTQFAGGMERQMDTLGGRLSNLKDNIFNFYVALGETGAADKLKGAIDLLNQGIVWLTNNLGVVGAALGVLAVRLAAVRAQMAVSAITGYLAQVIALERALGATSARSALFSAALKMVQGSFRSLTATMMVNPFVAIATAIAAVIALLYTYRNESIKVGDTTVTIGNIMAGAWEYIKQGLELVQKIFSEGWASALGSISEPLGTVGEWFDALGDLIYNFVNRTIGLFAGVAAAVKALFTDESFTDAFNRAFNTDYIGKAGEAIGDLAVKLNIVGVIATANAEASDDAADATDELATAVAGVSNATQGALGSLRDYSAELADQIKYFDLEEQYLVRAAQARELGNDELAAEIELRGRLLETNAERDAKRDLEDLRFEVQLLGMGSQARERAIAIRHLEQQGIAEGF